MARSRSGPSLLSRYGRAFPEAYKEDLAPRVAVADLKTIDALGDQESCSTSTRSQVLN